MKGITNVHQKLVDFNIVLHVGCVCHLTVRKWNKIINYYPYCWSSQISIVTMYPGDSFSPFLSALRCHQPKHYCQPIDFPSIHVSLLPSKTIAQYNLFIFCHHCDVGSHQLRLFQNGQNATYPQKNDRGPRGGGECTWRWSVDRGSLQGCLCPQGFLKMWGKAFC